MTGEDWEFEDHACVERAKVDVSASDTRKRLVFSLVRREKVKTSMVEPGKNWMAMSAHFFSEGYVSYFCLADAITLVSIQSFFLPVATYYIVVYKPLCCLREFLCSSTFYHGRSKTRSKCLLSTAMEYWQWRDAQHSLKL